MTYIIHITTLALAYNDRVEGWLKTGEHYDRKEAAYSKADIVRIMRQYNVTRWGPSRHLEAKNFYGSTVVEGQKRRLSMYITDERPRYIEISDSEADAFVTEAQRKEEASQ